MKGNLLAFENLTLDGSRSTTDKKDKKNPAPSQKAEKRGSFRFVIHKRKELGDRKPIFHVKDARLEVSL